MNKIKVKVEFEIDDMYFDSKVSDRVKFQHYNEIMSDAETLHNLINTNKNFKVRCSKIPSIEEKIEILKNTWYHKIIRDCLFNDEDTRKKIARRIKKYLGNDVVVICDEKNNDENIVNTNQLRIDFTYKQNNSANIITNKILLSPTNCNSF
jgi:hypothetical protein